MFTVTHYEGKVHHFFQICVVKRKERKMNTKENIAFEVIDAPTGAGKTTALIKLINAAHLLPITSTAFWYSLHYFQKYSGYVPIQTVGSL